MRKLPLPVKRKRFKFIKNRLHPLLQAQPFLFLKIRTALSGGQLLLERRLTPAQLIS